MLRVSEIKIPIEKMDGQALERALVKKLKINPRELLSYQIHKKAVDARKKDQIQITYVVDVKIQGEERLLARWRDHTVKPVEPFVYQLTVTGSEPLLNRPVVIGTGPAGLFAALVLAQLGYRPLVLERGKAVEERSRDVEQFWKGGPLQPESNVQFGEGGAGTFSDGKLTTQIKDPRCRKVLEELVLAGAREEILYHSKPHVGTDYLRRVVKSIREAILKLGGEVRFESKVTGLFVENNRIKGVEINGKNRVSAQAVVLAVGHSARDTFRMLDEIKADIEPKAFSIGVRIEHPQGLINESQYGRYAGHPQLGAADYKLSHHAENGRSAYTFCMCPGGRVVAAASQEGMVVTNGMSYYARSLENANSALLVGIGPEDFGSDHPLAGMFFQEKWERAAFEAGGGDYRAPVQLVGDFLADRPSRQAGRVVPSYQPGVHFTDLRLCLPDFVIDTLKEALIAMDKKIQGFALEDGVMTGIETRSSSPVRILRNQQCESNLAGLYPAGEGAGYAGGIISAAVDGIKVAEAIAARYQSPAKEPLY